MSGAGGVTILRSSLLLLVSSIYSTLPIVEAIRLHSTQGQRPAIVTMPNDLIARLRCSPTLGEPSALDKDWFNLQSRPSPVPRADDRVRARPRPRRASLSLVLREIEEGKVEMLVIKRAANPRRDLGVWCLCCFGSTCALRGVLRAAKNDFWVIPGTCLPHTSTDCCNLHLNHQFALLITYAYAVSIVRE